MSAILVGKWPTPLFVGEKCCQSCQKMCSPFSSSRLLSLGKQRLLTPDMVFPFQQRPNTLLVQRKHPICILSKTPISKNCQRHNGPRCDTIAWCYILKALLLLAIDRILHAKCHLDPAVKNR